MKLAVAARPALAKLIRLLGSDVDGEALGAVRALGRTLRAHGHDFHDLARLVEAPAAEPSGGRMRPGRHDHFDGDDDDPVDWEVMVAVCVDRLALFTAKERKFIVTLQGWGGEPSPKQLNWLAALFRRSA
jgi:hypothetical protein